MSSSILQSSQNNNDLTFDSIHQVASLYVHQQEKELDAREQTKDDTNINKLYNPRCQILNLGILVGDLCSAFLRYAPLDKSTSTRQKAGGEEEKKIDTEEQVTYSSLDTFWLKQSKERDEITKAIGSLFFGLNVASESCGIDLYSSILKKIELNGKKYPVELCKGKAGKYTKYSDVTGITPTKGQSTVHYTTPTKKVSISNHTSPRSVVDDNSNASTDEKQQVQDEEELDTSTLYGMTVYIRQFATERNWSKYHKPRSIVLALMGEMGELAELFQWKDDSKSRVSHDGSDDSGSTVVNGLKNWSINDIDHVGQEFADVSIYLIRLADICNIDLGLASFNYGQEQLKR